MVDNKTLDGFSDFDVNNIIQNLKDHSFGFKPVKRVYLEKPNGKKRPIGIPSPKDKVVLRIFKKHFKNRKIIPINCSILVWGFGTIHCLTQQEPI